MFGLGFGEIVLLAVIALLVFGPDKVPELMASLGKWTRYLRGATTELRRTIETEGRSILPPDLNLPRISDLIDPGARRPIPPPTVKRNVGAPGAPAARGAPPRNDEPLGIAEAFDAETSGEGETAGDAGGAAARDADRLARVDAIARALENAGGGDAGRKADA